MTAEDTLQIMLSYAVLATFETAYGPSLGQQNPFCYFSAGLALL